MSGINLYDYQLDAVNRMKNGCILCGGVGSGKSRTSLAYYYKEQGGIEALEKRDLAKAAKLYEAIDSSRMFVATVPNHEDRSIMNVCFVMKPEYKELEGAFLDFAGEHGMVGVKGHRDVGGFRASLYNALPMESVDALIECMKEFQAKH